MAVALSSTAIVLTFLGDRGATRGPEGSFSVGVLIFQDLAVVVMIFIVPFLAEGGAEWSTIGLTLAKAVEPLIPWSPMPGGALTAIIAP